MNMCDDACFTITDRDAEWLRGRQHGVDIAKFDRWLAESTRVAIEPTGEVRRLVEWQNVPLMLMPDMVAMSRGDTLVDFKNDVVSDVKVYGLEDSVRASKYPKAVDVSSCTSDVTNTTNKLGTADIGSGHDNFLNGIVVQFDLRFTVKAWTEEERYHFIDFISSQSTMHRITQFDLDKSYIKYVDRQIINRMKELVEQYNEAPSAENFLAVVYSNPCGFQLTARMTTNYRQLKTIYSQRKTHRLPEWHSFCEFCEALPHSEWITGNKE